MRAIKIILEKGDNEWWGRTEELDGLAVSFGKNRKELEENLRESVQLYLEENPREQSKKNLSPEQIAFSYSVDLEAFFEKIPELKISHIAKRAGINPSLVRQYAKGLKYPSIEQAEKIENAVRELAKELLELTSI